MQNTLHRILKISLYSSLAAFAFFASVLLGGGRDNGAMEKGLGSLVQHAEADVIQVVDSVPAGGDGFGAVSGDGGGGGGGSSSEGCSGGEGSGGEGSDGG